MRWDISRRQRWIEGELEDRGQRVRRWVGQKEMAGFVVSALWEKGSFI